MPAPDLYDRLRALITGIPLIDSHEHLVSEEVRLRQPADLFLWFTDYTSSDLVSAGMSPVAVAKLSDPEIPLDQRWAEFAPWWEHTRTTGYGRALLIAARDLFGIEDINQTTYARLSEAISAASRPGWYLHVLKERANIDIAVLDPLEGLDPTPLEGFDRRLFAPVLRMDDYILPCNRVELERLEAKANASIHSLDDLLRAMDAALARAVAAGIVGIKVDVAYSRTLYFEHATSEDAERAFARLRRHPIQSTRILPPLSWDDAKPLQDFLMHEVVRRAVEHGLPIQVHTGLLDGNGNYVAQANPLHLTNLLLEYPQARFDLFHAGYPFQSEMTTLAKNLANVYVDLCWVHVISPRLARQTLHEWIETVPANKIFAFGGDYIFVEGSYAHSVMARDNVAQTLAEKVQDGYLTEDEAVAMASKLLRENALCFFRLPQ